MTGVFIKGEIEDWVSLFFWTMILLFYTSCHSWDDSVYHHTQLLIQMRSHKLFAQIGFKLSLPSS
jgi:hypothetical protein